MICEVCGKREVTRFRQMNDHPFVIPFSNSYLPDGRTAMEHKVVRNMCDKCYYKIEKTMKKLMGL